MEEINFFAVFTIRKLLNWRFETMASSEGILGMMANPLRFHLHPFPGVIQMLWRYSTQDILLPKLIHKNPCREVSDFRLLGIYSSVYCKNIILLFSGFNVKVSLKYNIINNCSFSVKYSMHYLNIFCCKPIFKISFFLSFSFWSLLPTHCRCRLLLLHVFTLSDTHTHHTHTHTTHTHTHTR